MILYAGNILSGYGYTPTFIELLTPKLSERYKIISVSDKKAQSLRLLDMIQSVLKNKNELSLVLIDSYSRRAFWYTYVLSKICKHYNIPYIPILRGGGYPERLKSSPGLCRFIFSNSAKNISPSIYLKKHFEDEGYSVDYLPNFIPVENYTFKSRNSVRPKLLWVRSFHEIYNPLLAVRILKILNQKYNDAQLCMVGPDKDGSLQRTIDKVKESGLEASVKFTGKLSKEEWLELSRDYDIFINTTNFDNHPVSVIEAMALGLPVISTNVGGIPYLINDNDNGLLADADDELQFVDKIESLMNDHQLLHRLTANARKTVEGFDWKILKSEWYSTIDGVVNGTPESLKKLSGAK